MEAQMYEQKLKFDLCKMDLYLRAIELLRDPKHTRWLSPLLLAADACLCALIIYKVPCTRTMQAPAARCYRQCRS